MQRERATHNAAGERLDDFFVSSRGSNGPAWRPYEKHRSWEGSPPETAARPHFPPNKAIRRQRILRELIDGGVNVLEIPNGGYRLYGRYGDVILTTDLLSLLKDDIQRLTM